MSEIQDAVAVVELMGQTVAVGGRLGLFLSKGVINLAAAMVAYEKTHKTYKGEIAFSKFQKSFGREISLLSFPSDLSEEQLEDVGNMMKRMKIPYSWAPIYRDDDKPKVMAIRAGDAQTVRVVLEQLLPKDMLAKDYLDLINPDVIEKMSSKGFAEMDYPTMHAILSQNSGTLSEQLNHRIERDYEHAYPWVTFDVNNPTNYICQIAKRAGDYTKTVYSVYKNDVMVSEFEDGPGCRWDYLKNRMSNALGVTKDYNMLATLRSQDALERLKQYQKKSLNASELKQVIKPTAAEVDTAAKVVRENPIVKTGVELR